MPACPRHPTFLIEDGVYFRANLNTLRAWVPKNEVQREAHYQIVAGGDMAEVAALMGEVQMTHASGFSSSSGYLAVARCPACLSESPDPAMRKVLRASKMILCQLRIKRENEPGEPYVFHMAAEESGGVKTEALVLLPRGMSLIQFHDGYATQPYVDSLKVPGPAS